MNKKEFKGFLRDYLGKAEENFDIEYGDCSVEIGHSDLFEDKAVDLLVLKKSLQSIDGTTASKYFDNVLEGYAESYGKNKDKIIEKIKEIESRGRYTH